jgi:hypothetical protein
MTFDAAAPGNVAWVAEKSKNENLEAREIYTQKPYQDTLSPSRNLASFGITAEQLVMMGSMANTTHRSIYLAEVHHLSRLRWPKCLHENGDVSNASVM